MHKIAFEIAGHPIHWYGILAVIGFILGFWTAGRRGMRDGISPDTIADVGTWIIIGTIIGARANYVITFWHEEFAGRGLLEMLRFYRGGLVFYGGFIGASLSVILYAWKYKQPLWKLADTLAPSIALGHAFGRLGCLMTGCCYGRACDLPWAIQFPEGHETYPAHVHPTQIYESLLNFCLYAGLAWFYRRKRFDGQIFAAYLMCYAGLRSFVETFRGDYPTRYLWGAVTQAQMVGMVTFTTGAVLWWWFSSRPRPAKVPASTAT
ncbi:MAG TPA: prolipoprotein diacylglyceryl transferase [Verrucomicrobiae bacterium]|nr:prolipoprotein diacylglyceryl transferase [Verrucomicrobiae bacterium]